MKRPSVLLHGAVLLPVSAVWLTAAPLELPNAGFEQKLEGWRNSADNGMSQPVPEAAAEGKLGLRVTDKDPTEGSRITSPRYPAKPGATYRLTFKARSHGGRGMGVYLRFYDKLDRVIESPSGHKFHVEIPEAQKEWATFELKAAAPADAAKVEVVIRSNNIAVTSADLDAFGLSEE